MTGVIEKHPGTFYPTAGSSLGYKVCENIMCIAANTSNDRYPRFDRLPV